MNFDSSSPQDIATHSFNHAVCELGPSGSILFFDEIRQKLHCKYGIAYWFKSSYGEAEMKVITR